MLLGDGGSDGWGVRYATEFHMTNDSKLFPPRQMWEEKGYQPDEYSRWLKGNWRPIEELWKELGVDIDQPLPAEIKLEDWLFDSSADPVRSQPEAQFVHGHLLKPGDVARTDWTARCAQPPYDRLPVPRVAIPPGTILSRDGTEWIREDCGIEGVALPLYEGRMIGQFDFSEKGWVSGKGRGAEWREIPWERKQVEPQFLMGLEDYQARIESPWHPKVAHMDIGSATNARTAIGAFLAGMPSGNSAPTLVLSSVRRVLAATAVFGSLVSDFVTRSRVTGLHLNYHVIEQNPLLRLDDALVSSGIVSGVARALCLTTQYFSPAVLELGTNFGAGPRGWGPAVTASERLRLRSMLDALLATAFGLSYTDLCWILGSCDLPSSNIVPSQMNPKGFWRLDRDSDPELRHTVLTLVAFRNLESKIRDASGSHQDGIDAFLAQNEGEGWLLPETLCLADYDLGHDDRARQHQPVACRLGPRFYDWQLASGAVESWRETLLHSRNLLGRAEYAQFVGRHVCNEQPDSEALALIGPDGSKSATSSSHASQAGPPKPETSAPRAQTGSPKIAQMDLFE